MPMRAYHAEKSPSAHLRETPVSRDQFAISPKGIIHRPTEATYTPHAGAPGGADISADIQLLRRDCGDVLLCFDLRRIFGLRLVPSGSRLRPHAAAAPRRFCGGCISGSGQQKRASAGRSARPARSFVWS